VGLFGSFNVAAAMAEAMTFGLQVVLSVSPVGFVREGIFHSQLTHTISCGPGWRDACDSTRRDKTDRQLDRIVGPPVLTV